MALTTVFPTVAKVREALMTRGRVAAVPLRDGVTERAITLGESVEENLRVAFFGTDEVEEVEDRGG